MEWTVSSCYNGKFSEKHENWIKYNSRRVLEEMVNMKHKKVCNVSYFPSKHFQLPQG